MRYRTVVLAGFLGLVLSAVKAEDADQALSYGQPASKPAEVVTAMRAWAEGEHQEHEAEGLFKTHPDAGRLILDMLAVSKELEGRAQAAERAGDAARARAYYHSAEATAYYAARMPHLLEERGAKAGARDGKP